jgi:hypothetical protein
MAAKETAKKILSKSDFIRATPATMSAADVVAKGKAQGIKILPGLVYEVRRTAKAKKAVPQKTSTARTVAAATAKSKVTKADFVRAHANLSPQEIVKKGNAEGVKLGISYVYNVRGSDKKAGRKEMRTAARRSTARKALPVARPITTSTKAEDLLRAVAAEVGLGRAIELLEAERARVHAVMRG